MIWNGLDVAVRVIQYHDLATITTLWSIRAFQNMLALQVIDSPSFTFGSTKLWITSQMYKSHMISALDIVWEGDGLKAWSSSALRLWREQ